MPSLHKSFSEHGYAVLFSSKFGKNHVCVCVCAAVGYAGNNLLGSAMLLVRKLRISVAGLLNL